MTPLSTLFKEGIKLQVIQKREVWQVLAHVKTAPKKQHPQAAACQGHQIAHSGPRMFNARLTVFLNQCQCCRKKQRLFITSAKKKNQLLNYLDQHDSKTFIAMLCSPPSPGTCGSSRKKGPCNRNGPSLAYSKFLKEQYRTVHWDKWLVETGLNSSSWLTAK